MGLTVALSLPDGRQRSLFSLLLADAEIELITCDDSSEMGQLLAFRPCDLCVVSSRGPAADREALHDIKRVSPRSKLLLLCEKQDLEHVVPLFREGLDDVLVQPLRPKTAVESIRRLLADGNAERNEAAPTTLRTSIAPSGESEDPVHLISRSTAMRACIAQLLRLRRDAYSVLLRGEQGTEFELFAREVQSMWGEPEQEVSIIPPARLEAAALNELLENHSRPGRRVYFIPHVEGLSDAQQDAVIAFLRRLRGNREAQTQLRLVFSATIGLGSLAEPDSLFVEQLPFLVPTVIDVPPLRSRPDDIIPLAKSVLMDLTALFPRLTVRGFQPAALEWMQREPWPGNYEEFVGRIHRSVLQCKASHLAPRDLQVFFEPPQTGSIPLPLTSRLAQ